VSIKELEKDIKKFGFADDFRLRDGEDGGLFFFLSV
jgi:hypothetical protein